MRIVQIVGNLETGGLERQVVDLAYQQKLAGHESRIYCMFQKGSLAAQAECLGISVREFRKPGGLSFRTLWALARQLSTDRPDVVHTHNAVVHHYGVLAAKLAGIRVVVNTEHGTGTLSRDRKLARLFRAMLPWTNRVVMVGEGVRDYHVTKQNVPLSKAHVILNGIPLARFEPYRARVGCSRPRIRFGTVGRLVPEKDHRALLNAFSRVVVELPDAELHIVGDGILRGELEAQVRCIRLENRIHLHGARSDIGAFLSGLDIFVLSSVTEGLPIVVLEAMAVGLPIVSTRVNGVTEIASPDILECCDPAQPTSLAEAMLRMARKPDLAERGDAARKLASNRGIEQTWVQYEVLFQSLLDGEPSIPRPPITDAHAT